MTTTLGERRASIATTWQEGVGPQGERNRDSTSYQDMHHEPDGFARGRDRA